MRRWPLNYPYRTDEQAASLKRLPSTAYLDDDKPFLSTQRYGMSPNYEPSDVLAKLQVDLQGALDMQYSLHQWRQQ
jgi:hypothetical protein